MQTRTLSGDVLEPLGVALDDLHAATGAPVTARRPWLSAWVRNHPSHEPLVLVVQREDGRLEAAAPLARKRSRFLTEYVALGSGLSDQVRLPARTPEAARALAQAIQAELHGSRPWVLAVRHLPRGDPVARALLDELPCAELAPGDPSPTLRFVAGRSVRDYVSKNHHQQVRRMRNRIQGDGFEPRIEHLRERAAIEALLPEIERVCLARDLELRGTSLLDHKNSRDFFRAAILDHARRGEVELTTLHMGERLAAYVLCFLDQGAYRMWSCRLDPAWERYGVGRIANHVALEHALSDPAATEFDWMRGAEPYKMSLCNHVEQAVDLRAWSAPALRSVLDSSRRLRRLFKDVASEREWLRPALEASRRLKAATHRGRRAVSGVLRGPRE